MNTKANDISKASKLLCLAIKQRDKDATLLKNILYFAVASSILF